MEFKVKFVNKKGKKDSTVVGDAHNILDAIAMVYDMEGFVNILSIKRTA